MADMNRRTWAQYEDGDYDIARTAADIGTALKRLGFGHQFPGTVERAERNIEGERLLDSQGPENQVKARLPGEESLFEFKVHVGDEPYDRKQVLRAVGTYDSAWITRDMSGLSYNIHLAGDTENIGDVIENIYNAAVEAFETEEGTPWYDEDEPPGLI